jgi:hypothetical protein
MKPFLKKKQIMDLTLKKVPYHLKKLNKNKLLFLFKLYYKNLNNSVYLKEKNDTLHFLRLKDKFAHDIKKTELKKIYTTKIFGRF